MNRRHLVPIDIALCTSHYSLEEARINLTEAASPGRFAS